MSISGFCGGRVCGQAQERTRGASLVLGVSGFGTSRLKVLKISPFTVCSGSSNPQNQGGALHNSRARGLGLSSFKEWLLKGLLSGCA